MSLCQKPEPIKCDISKLKAVTVFKIRVHGENPPCKEGTKTAKNSRLDEKKFKTPGKAMNCKFEILAKRFFLLNWSDLQLC